MMRDTTIELIEVEEMVGIGKMVLEPTRTRAFMV